MTEQRKFVGVGVGAIIQRGQEILLLRRRNVHGAGTWSTPGGHIEFGESLEACAARETLEESGLVVGQVEFVAVTNDVMLDDDKHYVTVWMRCEYIGGDPYVAAAYEMDDIRWFALDELPNELFVPLRNLVASGSL